MDFWQSVTTLSLVFGLISSLVAVVGFFVDVTKLKHKHKILLVSVPLALIFIGGGAVSFAYRLTPSAHNNGSHSSSITANTTPPTSVPTTVSAFPPPTVTSSPATATITPTSPSSTNISPKNQTLPLDIPCVSGSCSSFPFTLTLNSITSSSTSGETNWVFTLVNNSGSNCGSVGFSPVPTLGSAQAQGQTTGWAMSQGQQLPVTLIFPQPQTGVPYDLNVKLVFQKCVSVSGGHGSGSDTYQTEAFVF